MPGLLDALAEEVAENHVEKQKRKEPEFKRPALFRAFDRAFIAKYSAALAEVRKSVAPATCCVKCRHPYCCQYQVPVSLEEAALIVRVHEALCKRLLPELLDSAHRDGLHPCAFLNTYGRCQIYDVAPLNCAYYFMSSLEKPQDCSPSIVRAEDHARRYGKLIIDDAFQHEKAQLVRAAKPLGLVGVENSGFLAKAVVRVLAAYDRQARALWRASGAIELRATGR